MNLFVCSEGVLSWFLCSLMCALGCSDTNFYELASVVWWSGVDGKGSVLKSLRPDFVLMVKRLRDLMLLAIEYKKTGTGTDKAETDRYVKCLAQGRVVLGWRLSW